MKVVILAGGQGTRVKEETVIKPKPMIEVGGKPMLWHIMKGYASSGFNEFVVCLGYKGQMIKEYFYHYEMLTNDFTIELGTDKKIEVHSAHAEDGWKVTLADTGESTLKGARIKMVEPYIDGDVFMLTYGDGVANVDLKALLEFHKSHGKIATVTGVRPPSRFGELTAKDSRVVHFSEKSQISAGMINGGFFVLNKEVFNFLNTDENCDFEMGTLEELAENGEMMVFEHKGDWACLDTSRDREYLNHLWDQGNPFWKTWS